MNKTVNELNLLGVTRPFEEAWVRGRKVPIWNTHPESGFKNSLTELRKVEGRSAAVWIEEKEFIRFIDALALKERTFEGYRSAIVWKGIIDRDDNLQAWARNANTKMYVAAASYEEGKGTRKNFDGSWTR